MFTAVYMIIELLLNLNQTFAQHITMLECEFLPDSFIDNINGVSELVIDRMIERLKA